MKKTLRNLYELVLEINTDGNSDVNILFKQDRRTLEILVYRKGTNKIFRNLFIEDYSKNKKETTNLINKFMGEIILL